MHSNLEQLREYKERIANLLLTSNTIVDALIEGTSLTRDDDLFYKVIFPYKKDFDMETETGSYILYEITNNSLRNNEYWKSCNIAFYIVVHNELLKTDFHGVRTDYLASEIDKLFNNNADFGIGKLSFVNDTAGSLDQRYYYRTNIYKTTDVNNSPCRR